MANGAELVSFSPLVVEKHVGSASTQNAANSNLVFTSFSSFSRSADLDRRVSHAGLYQGITRTLISGLHSEGFLVEFSTRLASIADDAYVRRRFDVVGSVGQLIRGLPPSRELESVGHFYEALSLNRGARGDAVGAGKMFERIAETAPLRYRARAMLALAGNSFTAGDRRTAMSFYLEVMERARRDRILDPMTLYAASRMTAVIRSMEGDHRGAVADLERMVPLARMAALVQPYAYYDYMNTLAVELGELGRLEQARHAAQIAIASPFASAYPEWRETFDEIEAKQPRASRSVVEVPHPVADHGSVTQTRDETNRDNLLRLPAAELSAGAGQTGRHLPAHPARVINLHEWKATLKGSSAPLRDRLSPEQMKRMTTGEKLIRLMDLISQDETDDETIDRILEAVEQIVLNRRSERLD